MKVKLARQNILVNAPRSKVFGLFTSFGENSAATVNGERSPEKPTEGSGEGATVVERNGNRLVVEFKSREGRKLFRTLEEVHLFPEEKITFRHIEGPLHHASEEFRLAEAQKGTQISYRGKIECRMPFMPGLGWLTALLYVRPKYGRVVNRHLRLLKESAETNQTWYYHKSQGDSR